MCYRGASGHPSPIASTRQWVVFRRAHGAVMDERDMTFNVIITDSRE